jgi:hypothetical protein
MWVYMLRSAFLLIAFAAVGCASSSAPESTDTGTGAATAEARSELDAYTGVWKVETDNSLIKVFPSAINVKVTDDAVDPVTHDTKGTRLQMLTTDTNINAVDRAPFINVDEGKSCESVSFDTGHSLGICHETHLSNNGHTLTHTVTTTEYKGWIFPAGWETATQVIELSGDKMHYTFTVDGELDNDVMLSR